MKQQELLELIDTFDKSGLTHLAYTQDGAELVLQKSAAQAVATPACAVAKEPPAPLATNGVKVKAPLVGVFYAAVSPESAPYVTQGQQVHKGQVLGLLEAMKMMSELTSPVDGRLERVLVQNEELVSFEQVLFEVVPC